MQKSVFVCFIALSMCFVCCKDYESFPQEPENVLDRLSKQIKGEYIDTTGAYRNRRFTTYDFYPDGTLQLIQFDDVNCDGKIGADTVKCTWELVGEVDSNSGDMRYYPMFISVKLAENPRFDPILAFSDYTSWPEDFEYVMDTMIVVAQQGKFSHIITDGIPAYPDGLDFDSSLNSKAASATRGWFDKIVKHVMLGGARLLERSVTLAESAVTVVCQLIDSGSFEGSTKYGDWMSGISSEIPVCHLSIPGTHDTFTYDVLSVTAPWAQTQVYGIGKQWDLGCRCFDIRLEYISDKKRMSERLEVTHGGLVSCNCCCQEALDSISDLLQRHSDETAIVILKFDEVEKKYCEEAFAQLDELIGTYYANGKIVDWRPDLTLGEARGKMIVLCRYDTNNDFGAPKASGWGDNNPKQRIKNATLSAPLYVQDCYEQRSDEYYIDFFLRKESAFIENMNYKAALPDSMIWAFNHTSGYTQDFKIDMSYSRVAHRMNPFAGEQIKAAHTALTGVIVMDFIGTSYCFWTYTTGCKDLPSIVINHNKNLTWRDIPFTKEGN